ncbi:MAG: 16S rRNA (cytidine(1402)-2'-O)-methyltransferase [Geminicoccaceae bacterium]
MTKSSGRYADQSPNPSDRSGSRKLGVGLYIVSTPIGNLADLTFRARDTLATADLVLCEDTRVTARLLAAYQIKRPTVAYHDHNAAAVRPRVLAALAEEKSVALCSDAGTPLVSDPGFKLVRAVIEAGHEVIPIPGASAPLAALVTSGLPTDQFTFRGFLPVRGRARKTVIEQCVSSATTTILFERASRLDTTLADLSAAMADRGAAVARELTKAFETVQRGRLSELQDRFAGQGSVKGEIVIVIGPGPSAAEWSDEKIDRMIEDALDEQSTSQAARSVAGATGRPKRDIYQRAVELSRRRAAADTDEP